MIRQSAWSILVGLLGLMAVSCRQSPDTIYQKSAVEAQSLIKQGETNKAVGVLLGLFEDKRFKSYRADLLSSILELQLSSGDIAGAQTFFRKVADRDLALASSRAGMIAGVLMDQRRYSELAAWCGILQGYSFEEGLLINLADQHFYALNACGKAVEIPAVLAAYLPKLKPGAALRLAQGQFSGALGADRRADAARILSLVENQVADSLERVIVVAGMKVDLWIAANDRPAADAFVRRNIDRLPNDSVIRNLSAVWDADLRAGDVPSADSLVTFVVENVKGRSKVREAAGSLWIRTAEQRATIPELVRRLVALKDFGFTHSFVLGEVETVYAKLLDQGKKEDFGPLYVLCEGFYLGADDEELKKRLVGILLDLGFYLEKYEESLKLAETAMKDADKDQTAMLVWKIKAHIALQKGQPQEAVKNFRAFMECVAKETGVEVDPADNTRVTREMILGLNAKRIGDILTGAGDKAEAAKAYAEAREYYQKALKEFPDVTTRENQKIQKQIAGIPGK